MVSHRAARPRRRRSISGFSARAARSANRTQSRAATPLRVGPVGQPGGTVGGRAHTVAARNSTSTGGCRESTGDGVTGMQQADVGSVDVVGAVAEAVMEASRDGTEAALRAGGALMAPQVHVLDERLGMPYLGYLTCRPFYRGNDVVAAMGMMGLFPAMLGGSRLVIAWEHRDLSVALDHPEAGQTPTGHVAVDAHRGGGHLLRWHPYPEQAGLPGLGGGPTVIPLWGTPTLHRDVELPNPVAALLAVWRRHQGDWSDADLLDAVARFDEGRYRIRWVARPPGEPDQPRWMHVLTPAR